MPLGVILIDWDSSQGPILKAKYTEKNVDFNIEYLNIFLLHTATGWTKDKAEKQLFTQYQNYNLVSRYIPVEKENVLRRIVLAIILEPFETKPNKYYEILDQIVTQEKIDSEDEGILADILQRNYETRIKAVSQTFSIAEVKKMIPLKTSAFQQKVNENLLQKIEKDFGKWAIDLLEQLPQDLEVERLESLFNRTNNEISKLILWASQLGLIRLVG